MLFKIQFQMRNILVLIALLSTLCAYAADWENDYLGNGFEMTYVQQPDDYSGKVRSTVIRRLAGATTGKALLYVHGFNDYFFQTEMAMQFNQMGYDFYAVDLRKYGRSIMPGQKKFQVRDVKEYFADVDSALSIIKKSGISEILLMGHSTGGLVVSCYMSHNPSAPVDALLLNSPFLDWNLGDMEKFVPFVSALGKIAPDFSIKQGGGNAYSESLLKSGHGEWTYNTEWKLQKSPDVDAGWVRAIDVAQRDLRSRPGSIAVPILLMYSSHSAGVSSWTPEANRADIVLDVHDIKHYGLMLGPNVTFTKVMGGIHDLMLSAKGVRQPLYEYIFKWVSTVK